MLVENQKDTKSIRVNLSGPIVSRWDDFLERKNVSQQGAIEALIAWIIPPRPGVIPR